MWKTPVVRMRLPQPVARGFHRQPKRRPLVSGSFVTDPATSAFGVSFLNGGDDTSLTYPAYFSSTVAAKTIVPTIPIIPAIINGACGVIFQSNPPIAAAGVIDRLRTR